MDQKMLKLVYMGACAYFLIVDSVLSFLLETWFTSIETGLLLSASSNLLMMAAGLVFLKKYKNALPGDHDEIRRTAGAASMMVGGSAILIITVQLMLRGMLLWLGNFNWDALLGGLFFHGMICAFGALGAICLWIGLVRTKDQPNAAELRVLCYRTALIFLLFRGINYLMWWFQSLLLQQYYELNSRDLLYNIMPVASVAAALILYFAPMNFNTPVRSMDDQRYRVLSGWAQVISGWLLLLTAAFSIIEQLILVIMQLFSMFGGFSEDFRFLTFMLSFTSTLVLMMIGAALIATGRRRI